MIIAQPLKLWRANLPTYHAIYTAAGNAIKASKLVSIMIKLFMSVDVYTNEIWHDSIIFAEENVSMQEQSTVVVGNQEAPILPGRKYSTVFQIVHPFGL